MNHPLLLQLQGLSASPSVTLLHTTEPAASGLRALLADRIAAVLRY